MSVREVVPRHADHAAAREGHEGVRVEVQAGLVRAHLPEDGSVRGTKGEDVATGPEEGRPCGACPDDASVVPVERRVDDIIVRVGGPPVNRGYAGVVERVAQRLLPDDIARERIVRPDVSIEGRAVQYVVRENGS